MSSTRGAIVLCGGRSSRMGRDKAALPFGDESMLQRVVRIVAEVVPAERIVVVAAPDQPLPPVWQQVQVARDELPHQGPLVALATGISALEGRADAAFLCGCDMPLLRSDFVRRVFELLGNHQIATVQVGKRLQPLGAVYRLDVLPKVNSLLAAGEHSLSALLERADSLQVPVKQLQDVDPELCSLATCNTLDEYQSLLRGL